MRGPFRVFIFVGDGENYRSNIMTNIQKSCAYEDLSKLEDQGAV